MLEFHSNTPIILENLVFHKILYKNRFCNKKGHYKPNFIYSCPRRAKPSEDNWILLHEAILE